VAHNKALRKHDTSMKVITGKPTVSVKRLIYIPEHPTYRGELGDEMPRTHVGE